MIKTKKLINLTPHDVVILAGVTKEANGKQVSIPRSNSIARVSLSRVLVDTVTVDGVEVDINASICKEVTNLPEPVEGTYFIVSRVVADACPEREDLLVPDKVTHGAGAKFCRSFSIASFVKQPLNGGRINERVARAC